MPCSDIFYVFQGKKQDKRGMAMTDWSVHMKEYCNLLTNLEHVTMVVVIVWVHHTCVSLIC
jgi:hypothetical protein